MIIISEKTKSIYAYEEISDKAKDKYHENGYSVVRIINGNVDVRTMLVNIIKNHI